MQYLNTSQLGDLTGCDRRTVSRRLKEAGVQGRRNGSALEYPSKQALIEILIPEAQKVSGDESASERQANLKAEKLQIEVEKLKGQSIPRSEVIAWASDIVSRARSKILAIPGRIAPEVAPSNRTSVVKASEKVVREALEELAALGDKDET